MTDGRDEPRLGDPLDAVLSRLDEIIEINRQETSRMGYFAAMYRRVTAEVQVAINRGLFEDGARMAKLDAVFAERYIDAWSHFHAGRNPTGAWRLAFDAAASPKPIFIQHLLLGMNAHINLDLGIAAATVSTDDPGGPGIEAFKPDFMAINGVLAGLVAGLVSDVGRLSPWLGLLDRLGGINDDHVIRFSIEVARDEAWVFAQQLAALDPAEWNDAINRRDRIASAVGRRVLKPGPWIAALIAIVHQRESSDIVAMIDHLR